MMYDVNMDRNIELLKDLCNDKLNQNSISENLSYKLYVRSVGNPKRS
ncbi:hypothetical protein [Candidatus Mycoplasma haematobovis]|nr:hypothetical protein [Candidatus Mycoplasma haematobovis]